MRSISITVACAVYLLVGCAPTASQRSQGIRPVSTRPPGKPIGKPSGTDTKTPTDGSGSSGTGSETAEDKSPTDPVVKNVKPKIDELIAFIHQDSPSFANQLKWALKQTSLRMDSALKDKNESEWTLAVVISLLKMIRQLDPQGQEFCLSYKAQASECRDIAQKASLGSASGDGESQKEVAKVLLQKNRETLRPESLASLLSTISIKTPYLKKISFTGEDILKGVQKLDGKTLKRKSDEGKGSCQFQVTSKNLLVTLNSDAQGEEPEAFDVPLESIHEDQQDSVVADEQSSLLLFWKPDDESKAALMTRNLDPKSEMSGFYYKDKLGEITCQ